VSSTEELLRRLARNDEPTVQVVLRRPGARAAGAGDALDDKTQALVHLGALLSVDAATDSCRLAVDIARAAGASDTELVGVLLAVGPVVGFARLVTAAPRLALAIGYDVADD
jgi:alkylhydroperoxidase/carboxymuconolactone decarboxylase family protein YurZ